MLKLFPPGPVGLLVIHMMIVIIQCLALLCVHVKLCTEALASGWSRFKVKVGAELEDDKRRCGLIRQMIGPDKTLVRLITFECIILFNFVIIDLCI